MSKIDWETARPEIQTAAWGWGELSEARRAYLQRQQQAKKMQGVLFWNRMRLELQETAVMWQFDEAAHPDRQASWE